MKKLYFPWIVIAALSLGSCSQDLPSVPAKNQNSASGGNTETPETPVTTDYTKLNTLLQKLNLEDEGLFRVKAALNAKDTAQAQQELLRYFRERTSLRNDVQHTSVNITDKASHKGEKLAAGIVKQANDALNHIFLANKNFDPIAYGPDIDWGKSHPENEVRWQLHRMYWWAPMGQVYWSTLDEKYAKEWVAELQDWIKKNPCDPTHANYKWAWRALEVGIRLSDQTALMNYFITSEHFTPEVLTDFLLNYWTQCDFLNHPGNLPDDGNHLLFCGNGLYTGGCFFPEFKDATTWRQSATTLLNAQLDIQVYDDGSQNEFAPKYQAASISQFLQAMDFAYLNSRESDFPTSYSQKIRKMIDVIIDLSVVTTGSNGKPTFDVPMFGDTDHFDTGFAKYFNTWKKYYPNDAILEFFATTGGGGTRPAYTSAAHKEGGYFTFRNGWTGSNIILPVTAHPEQVWHSHPDVGTFELSVKGRLLMPDAGYYKYEGDKATNAERNLFRRSCIHKIMTLDNKNITVENVNTHWDISKNLQVLRIENQSYPNMKVCRTIFFQSKGTPYPYFVIVDEGIGDATGNVQVHFNVCEDANATFDNNQKQMYTGFSDRNVLIQSFCPGSANFTQKAIKGDDARISYKYGETKQGVMVAFETPKAEDETTQIITVICPFDTERPEFTNATITGSGETLEVNIDVNGQTVTFKP